MPAATASVSWRAIRIERASAVGSASKAALQRWFDGRKFRGDPLGPVGDGVDGGDQRDEVARRVEERLRRQRVRQCRPEFAGRLVTVRLPVLESRHPLVERRLAAAVATDERRQRPDAGLDCLEKLLHTAANGGYRVIRHVRAEPPGSNQGCYEGFVSARPSLFLTHLPAVFR